MSVVVVRWALAARGRAFDDMDVGTDVGTDVDADLDETSWKRDAEGDTGELEDEGCHCVDLADHLQVVGEMGVWPPWEMLLRLLLLLLLLLRWRLLL